MAPLGSPFHYGSRQRLGSYRLWLGVCNGSESLFFFARVLCLPRQTRLLPKYFFWKASATLTSPIITGTSISGPITAANAAPEWIPKTATATAIASSKLLLEAVKDKVAVLE